MQLHKYLSLCIGKLLPVPVPDRRLRIHGRLLFCTLCPLWPLRRGGSAVRGPIWMHHFRVELLVLPRHLPARRGADRTFLQQPVASHRRRGIGIVGNCKNIFSLVQCVAHCDERAALFTGLYHEHAHREPRDYSVPDREVPWLRAAARRIFRQQASFQLHIGVQLPVGSRIDHICAAAKHSRNGCICQ